MASSGAVLTALAEAVADATALAAAELVGLSERAFEITLAYIKTREQFDKPIGSFQVIQHRAVDLNVMCEVAQAGVREALAQMDSETDPKVRAPIASRAKARAVTAAKRITRDAIQLHGAVVVEHVVAHLVDTQNCVTPRPAFVLRNTHQRSAISERVFAKVK